MRVQVLPLGYRAACPACDGDAARRPRWSGLRSVL